MEKGIACVQRWEYINCIMDSTLQDVVSCQVHKRFMQQEICQTFLWLQTPFVFLLRQINMATLLECLLCMFRG